jgi:hypothetical protein
MRRLLKVKVSDWPGDPPVTQQVQHALARDSYLADFELRAASHFGKVYLRGEVNTHFEKERAEVVVANVPGALDVVNRITADARWQAAGEGLFGSGHEATAAQQRCIRNLRDALALDREPSAAAEIND